MTIPNRPQTTAAKPSTAIGSTKSILVLVGGGHSHIQVALNLSKAATSSTTCVLVSDSEHAAYSGMLPAVVAGLVQERRAHVNLRDLCARNGLHFVHAAVSAINADHRELRFRPCADLRAPECRMRFDFLSINVGSRTIPIPERFPIAQDLVPFDSTVIPMVVETRPILHLAGSISRFEVAARNLPKTADGVNVVIVGGGAAGIELALAVETRLSQSLGSLSMVLVSKGESFATAFGRQAGTAVLAELKKRAIKFRFGTTAVAVNRRAGLLIMDDSPTIHFDLLVVATGATSHAWISQGTDLPVDENGWLLVEPTLQCKGHSNIFASGDCISFGGRFGENFPPKAGVYAVREGPILTQNIEAAIRQDPSSSFKHFVPQSSFLSLLSTGDGRGIGSKYGLVLKGTWVYRLKSYIDESWQDRFRAPPKNASDLSSSSEQGKDRVFDGSPAEGAALLQAADDILEGDSFEKQLSVLHRMDTDEKFRRKLLEYVKRDP